MSLWQKAKHKRRFTVRGIEFDRKEVRDLLLAWAALGLAFTFFLGQVFHGNAFVSQFPMFLAEFVEILIISIVAVGTGFLLHELAHKVVAIRYGQIAAFRADYAMLGIAIASGLAGFIFAAPGAVHHRGYITDRENGLIAVAGPLTNIGLALVFLPFVFLPGFVGSIAWVGVVINVFLAAFNMIPFGPLDGRTVLDWSTPVFVAVFVGSIAFGAGFLLFI